MDSASMNLIAEHVKRAPDPQAWYAAFAVASKDALKRACEEASAKAGGGQPVELSSARAPHGYTRQKPLVIQGHSYVGGEFIPGDVMAKATSAEKAKIRGGAPSQSAMAQQHEKAHANDRPAPKPQQEAEAAAEPQATEPAGGSASGFQAEPHTPPPPGTAYVPNVQTVNPATGTTAAARVGVPGSVVPPPPPIGVLPNLTDRERTIERSFASAYEAEPDMVADDYRLVVHENTTPGDPPTFETDGAKVLMNEWMDKDQATRAQNRATLNTPLHQTANAVCKRAFLKHLDTLHKGDQILVTVGGCGAGKGFALKKIPQALALKKESRVVWDSAGDQCATENPWIQSEAEKRGLKVAYVFVHADPKKQWADPERGVVKRAADPSDGRMVGAAVFADSYALGAKNMQAHYEKHKDNPNASFMFLQNAGPTPQQLPGIPAEALNIDRHELRKFAVDTVNGSNAPDHVKRGALMDQRIWPESTNKPASNQPAAASNQ